MRDGTLLTQWGSSGVGPGQFDLPFGIAVGGSDNVFVADTYNHRIQKFGPLVTPVRTTSWGSLKARYH
jgi:hypothetical protein